MTDIQLELNLERDAAYLVLLWLLIHGGDPLNSGVDNPVQVSDEVSDAALDLVTKLSIEFADTRLTEHSQFAARMKERFNIEPRTVDELLKRVVPDHAVAKELPFCIGWTGDAYCVLPGSTAN
jgi:hypothetical protein